MALLSKKKLIPLLIEKGFITGELSGTTKNEFRGVGYEAYGRKVLAFIQVKDLATRLKLEDYLEYELKQKPNRNYWVGQPVVEVQVSYFKAWHWDE